MTAKIFSAKNGAKVMVMESEEFVEYYLQINSSNWHFCVGSKENFDEVGQADAENIADQYFNLVDENEKVLEKHSEEAIAGSEANEEAKPVEFRKELVWLMVRSVTTNLELCACENKDSNQYCEMLMDKLDEAYNNDDIEEVDKLLGMIQKVLLENNII